VPVGTDIGKRIRSAFCAKDDKHVIIAADYSQIELRIVAFLAKDLNLTDILRSEGETAPAVPKGNFHVRLEVVSVHTLPLLVCDTLAHVPRTCRTCLSPEASLHF
jgi:DNA polymerase-1